MSGMMSINVHLKGLLVFKGVFDMEFLFIVYICHDVQKGSVSTLSSVSFQNIPISTSSCELVDLCPNR